MGRIYQTAQLYHAVKIVQNIPNNGIMLLNIQFITQQQQTEAVAIIIVGFSFSQYIHHIQLLMSS